MIKKIYLKYFTFIVLFASIALFGAGKVEAHPGRTDSSGGHTCRTNCEDWGLDYGEYHYHNGGYTTPYTTPYSTPYTTPIITSPKPSPKSTPSPSPTPIFSPSPSSTPEVKGETTQQSPSPVAQTQTGTGEAVAGLLILGSIGGGLFWLIKTALRRFKKTDSQ